MSKPHWGAISNVTFSSQGDRVVSSGGVSGQDDGEQVRGGDAKEGQN